MEDSVGELFALSVMAALNSLEKTFGDCCGVVVSKICGKSYRYYLPIKIAGISPNSLAVLEHGKETPALDPVGGSLDRRGKCEIILSPGVESVFFQGPVSLGLLDL